MSGISLDYSRTSPYVRLWFLLLFVADALESLVSPATVCLIRGFSMGWHVSKERQLTRMPKLLCLLFVDPPQLLGRWIYQGNDLHICHVLFCVLLHGFERTNVEKSSWEK